MLCSWENPTLVTSVTSCVGEEPQEEEADPLTLPFSPAPHQSPHASPDRHTPWGHSRPAMLVLSLTRWGCGLHEVRACTVSGSVNICVLWKKRARERAVWAAQEDTSSRNPLECKGHRHVALQGTWRCHLVHLPAPATVTKTSDRQSRSALPALCG